MKKQQKLLNCLLLLFCFGIIIVSCSLEEEVIHEHNHQNALKVETMSYKDLIKNNQFSKAFKSIPKKKVLKTDALGRSVFEETMGFTILDAPVKVIENNEKTSYILQIITDDSEDSNKLKNLILFANPTNDKNRTYNYL
jgi:hypothetical protein